MASPGFVAIAEGIRAAAGQAAAAAEGARELGLGAVATTISGALGGTHSASAASELSTAWDTTVSTWRADVAAHAQRLTDSATTYRTSDVDAGGQFRRIGSVI